MDVNDRSYVKLFSSIVTSSMWSEDPATRVVWVTMLSLKDKFQEVHAALPGLARAANVPLADAEAAIRKFLSPDPYSRTKEHEGRRIEEIPGGWRILNGEYYRRLMSIEERREYKRIKEAERRQRMRGKNVDKNGQGVTKRGQKLAEAEAEAEADTETIKTSTPQPPKGGGLVFPESLNTPEFKSQWEVWETARRKMKGCKDWAGMFQGQLNWLAGFGPAKAIAVLQQSIRNGWKGIFEVEDKLVKMPNVNPANGAQTVVHHEEFKRVEQKMRDIKNSYAEHQSWLIKDVERFESLKARKKELMIMLGMQV